MFERGLRACWALSGRAMCGTARLLRDCARLELDLLLPPYCLDCQAPIERPPDGLFLCKECRTRLAADPGPRCAKCGTCLPQAADRCPWCRKHQLQFDAVTALGPYEGQLRSVVLRMKRSQGEPLARAMGRLLMHTRGERLRAYRPDLIVPVPMHWSRRLARAANSPETVAKCLARELGVPLHRALLRIRKTKPQRDLRVGERFRNLRGALAARAGYDLRGSRVLVVDDILTTGATGSAAAEALKNAGAAAVAVAILARADGSCSP